MTVSSNTHSSASVNVEGSDLYIAIGSFCQQPDLPLGNVMIVAQKPDAVNARFGKSHSSEAKQSGDNLISSGEDESPRWAGENLLAIGSETIDLAREVGLSPRQRDEDIEIASRVRE